MIEMPPNEDFLARISTIEGAQSIIEGALEDIHARSRIINDEEISPPDYDKAKGCLRFALQNLPPGIVCISILTEFPRVTSQLKLNVEHELRTLQHLLGQIEPAQNDSRNFTFEFVVRPPSVPDKLKKESHGSYARGLSHDVVETLMLGYSSMTHVLVVKPHGLPEGEAGISALKAKPFRVPLRYVKSINLHTEQRPLTPYLEGDDWDKLQKVSVAYS